MPMFLLLRMKRNRRTLNKRQPMSPSNGTDSPLVVARARAAEADKLGALTPLLYWELFTFHAQDGVDAAT